MRGDPWPVGRPCGGGGGMPACRGSATGRPGAALHAQPSALSGTAVRCLVGWPGGGAGQCEAASERGAVDRGQLPGPLGLCDVGCAAQPRRAHGTGRCDGRRQRGLRCVDRRCVLRPAPGRRCRSPARHHRARTRRHRVVVLHQWHHRSPQGRDDHAPQSDDHGSDLLQRRGPHRCGRRHRLRCPHVTRRRHLRHPAPHGRRAPCGARFGRFRRGGVDRTRPPAGPALAVCRTHHCQAHRGRSAGTGPHA